MHGKNSKVSQLDDIGDRDATPGTPAWVKWQVTCAKSSVKDIDKDVSLLQLVLDNLERHEAWTVLGYPSLSLLCYSELGFSDDVIDAVRKAKKGESLRVVIARGEAVANAAKNTTGKVESHGGDRKSKDKSRGNLPLDSRSERAKANGVSVKTQQKLDALANEAPELLEQVQKQEISCHAACIKAGIVKVPTPLDIIKKAWDKASEEERREFLTWLKSQQ